MIFYHDIEQGTPEWFKCRMGILTASEMKAIITPKTLKLSSGSESHIMELLGQRVRKYVEPTYLSYDMIRGHEDEPVARKLYEDRELVTVKRGGFITNSRHGFTLGYSPDGLVADNGAVEIKSRNAKYQMEIILNGKPDVDHIIQLQTGLMVSEREWIDYISYCRTPEGETDDGRKSLPMIILRVYSDKAMQEAILTAATQFYEKLESLEAKYHEILSSEVVRLAETDLVKIQQEIEV